MTAIQTYLYPNTVVAEIWDPSIFTTRNRAVYARPVTVYQGIDNPIQVTVKNQDQKPVNMTGYLLQVDIQDTVASTTVQSLGVNFANLQLGRGSFTISKELANSLDQRRYKLTFRTIRTDNNTEQPVYIDDNFGVPLDLEILPAYRSTTTNNNAIVSGTIIYDGGLI